VDAFRVRIGHGDLVAGIGSALTTLTEDPLCSRDRGDVFTISSSKSWYSLGIWQLGLEYLRIGSNGDYGFETVAADSDITGRSFSMNNVITAAVNSTDIFLGFFGLGITQGSFGDKVAESPLTQAVKAFGWIPSYSYGFTAGASYSKLGPVSSTQEWFLV
jgi:hypothetical protein